MTVCDIVHNFWQIAPQIRNATAVLHNENLGMGSILVHARYNRS
jgi:hypothetical protein